jgi:CPA2 family monovalent cation:H+ antiporter-2
MVAIFFSSIGLLLDLNFFYHNYLVILLLSFVALVTNTFINAIVLRVLGRSWSESILTSSYLAQIGEFSFILAAIGLGHNVINEYSYQLTIYIIFITIVLTPLWVKGISKMAYKKEEI